MNSLLLALTLSLPAAGPAAEPTPRVLIVLTSHARLGDTGGSTGFYLGEVTHPLAEFEAAGLGVDFASIQGGEPPVDGLDLEDPINARYWADGGFRAALRQTARLADVDASRYAAVFYAGGHGTMWDFPDDPGVHRVTREVWEADGVVAAVCHGPAALVNVLLSNGRALVDGRRIAAFTDAEEHAVKRVDVVPFLLSSTLAERGAIPVPGPDFQARVIVDGRLVTGQNPASARGTAEAVVAALRAAAWARP
jgi:putative intracellular protease/amidase